MRFNQAQCCWPTGVRHPYRFECVEARVGGSSYCGYHQRLSIRKPGEPRDPTERRSKPEKLTGVGLRARLR